MTQFCVAQEGPGVEGFCGVGISTVVSDPVESCVQPEDCVVGFHFVKEEASFI